MTPVRAGDVVRVRSREEILATLDSDASIDAMPFMPEMLKFCGQELRVRVRAHKTCDTVDPESLGSLREVDNAVHLVNANCDGSAHGGCQAGCPLFFREEWLSVNGIPLKEAPARDVPATEETLHSVTRKGEDAYRCQATELLQASRRVQGWGHFTEDLRSGNVDRWTWLKGMVIQLFNKHQWDSHARPKWTQIMGGRTFPFWKGTGDGKRVPHGKIQVGDLVEVRGKKEIMPTLSAAGKNGGMIFDAELLAFAGRRARVDRRVEQIIHEPTGKMIKLVDCLVLEDVNCLGTYHRFCPRATPPYWREAWLKKIEE